MAIADYSDLKAAITNFYVNRTDLAAMADDFIDLAEAYFNTELRTREMEAITDLTPVSNVCTLPADYIEYKRVVEKASIRRPLEFITADAADHLYADRSAGLACHFMIVGDDLTALPLSTKDIELTYYQKIPALSDSTTTNWLLDKMPNLYLHACLLYAAEFTKNTERMATETAFVNQYMESLKAVEERAKYGNAGVVLTGNVP